MVFGHLLREMSQAEAIETAARVCGVVSPWLPLLECLTLSQNIAIPLALDTRPAAEIKCRVDEMLGGVGLSDARDRLPVECDDDERVRCMIARALIHRPPLLFLDSPTDGMEKSAAAKLQELLGGLVSEFRVTALVTCEPGAEPDWLDETLELALPEAA